MLFGNCKLNTTETRFASLYFFLNIKKGIKTYFVRINEVLKRRVKTQLDLLLSKLVVCHC